MAWWRWTPSKDPDDYREGASRPSARSRPKDWPEGLPWDGSDADHDPAVHGSSDDDEDGQPEPRLHPRQRWALMGTIVGVWVVAMAFLGVHWWDFEQHGPWLTPLTPFVLTGALEGALIARRPELNRHYDPEEPLRRRRRAHELGERARPYWAREGRDAAPPEGAGEVSQPDDPQVRGDG